MRKEQVWDPFVISRFPVFTPSDRSLPQSVWGSEGELTVLAGAAAQGRGCSASRLLPGTTRGVAYKAYFAHKCTCAPFLRGRHWEQKTVNRRDRLDGPPRTADPDPVPGL